MNKRFMTMLGRVYDPLRFKAEGSYMSEKYDGIRALWLPFTRDMNFSQVPWANRQRDQKDYVCSGLWTRRGKTIQAPDWFLDALPNDMPLDGELYLGRNRFEETMSVVRKHEPVDSEWEGIRYMVFGLPCLKHFFSTGLIREGGTAGDPAYECFFKPSFVNPFPHLKQSAYWEPKRFNEANMHLSRRLAGSSAWLELAPQVKLPGLRQPAEEIVVNKLSELVGQGAEGVMLIRGHVYWEPIKSLELAKVKPENDAEGTVIGYVFGNGKYEGMIGAIRLKSVIDEKTVVFDISGWTDLERQIGPGVELCRGSSWADHAGDYTTAPLSERYPVGTVITYKYCGLTDEGIPKFARPHRKFQVL